MHRLLRVALVTLLLAGATWPLQAAEIAEDDVLLKTEIENWGANTGLTQVPHLEASGNIAMAMAPDAAAVGGLAMQPGDYSLVFWQTAPAGDADGFFVEINGQRTRLLGTIGRWGTLAMPFSVKTAGPVSIAILGQEDTMTVDRIAVVRGTYKSGDIDFADIPGETAGHSIGLEDIPRLAAPCTLVAIPEAPLAPDEHTIFSEDFNTECVGVTGDHRWTEGPFGQALTLDMPDGRFAIDASSLGIGEAGTVEWWVKPREAAHVWWDQGWHYFLHAEPAQPGGTQLDLYGLRANLLFVASADGEPYTLTDGDGEKVQFGTSSLDITKWHHVLVSWDLRGDRQFLWALVDGRGVRSFFPRAMEPGAFARIELGNTPSDWDIPYLAMDGAIDAIRISNVPVTDRIAE